MRGVVNTSEETKPKNHGNPWTKALEVELMEYVDRRYSSEKIARKLERTTVSIELAIKRIKIDKFLKQRNIERLVHFTDVRNLDSIKKFGILPIKRLEEKNIKYYFNDLQRRDNQLGGSSVSITLLNKHLFRAFQIRNKKRRWVEVEINPIVVAKRNCLFYCCNASSSKFKGASEEYLSSYDALASMFAETVTDSKGRTYDRKDKKPNQTTNEQAEIIVKWMIPKSQILRCREL